MLFNSHAFLCGFLPVVLLLYHLLGRFGPRRWGTGWLIIASLFFYGWWNPKYLALIGASILGNYALGTLQGRTVARLGRGSRAQLALGVCANLGVLVYYKYASFFLDTAHALLGIEWAMRAVVLPLGISFITFQKIAYLVDAYYGKAKAAGARGRSPRETVRSPAQPTMEPSAPAGPGGYDFHDFCLFVLFFPQLIAGPIVHHAEVIPQFRRMEGGLRTEHLSVGGTIFVIGLFKKVVFADSIGQYANQAFAGVHAGAEPALFTAWGAALAYTLQLYFDFSGYSDMAIGLGRMFGVRLPLNFDSPYRAGSIIDFWRRWHMTLSRFLRDYVYIPLGGGRCSSARRYGNLMATMLIGGLWHGAGWTFVLWGGLHGAYLMVNHGWRHLTDGRAWAGSRWLRPGYHALTLLAVVVGWVFFRAATFDDAVSLLAGMVGLHGAPLPLELQSALGRLHGLSFAELGYSCAAWLWIIALGAIALGCPNTQEIMHRAEPALTPVERPARVAWRSSFRWATATGVAAVLALMGLNRVSEFLYFQF
jgi:D-alanyl-lipoteichoic acid acyltransferase DltB (MBOAT superfamily)